MLELSTVNMVIGGVCTVTGVAITVLTYAIYSGRSYGKMEAVVTQAKLDIIENTSDIDNLGSKVDKNKDESFNEFVHKHDCEAINKNWQTLHEGLMDRRDIFNEQNAKDHNRIGEALNLFVNDSKDDRKVVADKLDKISQCLHAIQAKKDCT